MSRLKILLMILVIALLFSSCGSNKLEEGQTAVTIKSNGDVAIDFFLSDDDAEDEFDIDLGDKKDDIVEDLEEFFDDQNIEAKVTVKKKTKNNIMFTALFEEGEVDIFEIDNTLEDIAEDYGYGDIEGMAELVDFVYYKNGKDVDEDDLEDYADYITMRVSASDEGTYLTVPGKIEIVSEDLDYKKINNNTIFFEDQGYVIFKK